MERQTTEIEFSGIVRESIGPVSFWLGVLYAAFTLSHWFNLAEDIRVPMSLLAGLVCIVMFGLRLAIQYADIPDAWIHPISAAMMGMVLMENILYLVLTRDVNRSVNLMIALTGAGFFMLSTRWYVVVLMMTLAGWGISPAGLSSSHDVFYLGFGLFTSAGISFIIHYIHVQTLRKLESAKLHEKNAREQLNSMVEARDLQLKHARDKISSHKGLEQDLELARQVQDSLLSRVIPELDGFIFAATVLPARYIGGDFYDFLVKGRSCYLTIADISGKGIPAAMLTSTARALVRAAIDRYEEPASILQDAERIIYQDLSRSEMFTTVLNLRLDFDMSTAYYANAGHTEGIWYSTRDGICHSLPATGIPFGVLKDNEITQKKINLRVGDILVFYSDGITETVNARQELFGFERLVGVVTEHITSSAHTLAQFILVEAELFADGAPLADDITLVTLKVMPHKVKFDYTATMESLDVILSFIRSNAEGYGEDFAYAVELASSEIITNVIQHAYNGNGGELFGSIHLLADGLEIDFYDMGIVYDPAKSKMAEPGSLQEGGYGLHIINQVMDEVTHKPRDFKGNHWRLVKKLST